MSRPDVVVVGAGITGLSIAFFLAREGSRVTVLERSGVAAGASGIQPGGVRQQWSTRVNCALARESAIFYRDLDERLGRSVGARLEECGYLFVAHGDEALEQLRRNVALQNELGVPSRIVGSGEAAGLVPGLDAQSLAGAAWCAEDAYFDRPQTVVEAFAAAAVDSGAEIRIEEVNAVQSDGRYWCVRTTAESIATEQVVLATGCDTPPLLERLGFTVPIVPEARHLFFSEPISERLLEPLVFSPQRHFAAKQLANGRVLASDLAAAGDPAKERDTWRQTVARGIDELLPVLSYVPLPVLATGLYDLTPDHQPLIGEVPAHDGLWLAAGYSGHGFMLAPALSSRIAASLAGRATDDLLSGFDLDRFDGANLEAETQIV